jgi:hypothetical protein
MVEQRANGGQTTTPKKNNQKKKKKKKKKQKKKNILLKTHSNATESQYHDIITQNLDQNH